MVETAGAPTPEQHGRDFIALRRLLNETFAGNASTQAMRPLIQGPDVCFGLGFMGPGGFDKCANLSYFEKVLVASKVRASDRASFFQVFGKLPSSVCTAATLMLMAHTLVCSAPPRCTTSPNPHLTCVCVPIRLICVSVCLCVLYQGSIEEVTVHNYGLSGPSWNGSTYIPHQCTLENLLDPTVWEVF